jgi:UDP-GlcNAc:undecaprenyl-phosphate GlcNAc-1-phosphate transferase
MRNPGSFWDFILTFTAVLVVMPVLIGLAPRLGLEDQPDERKDHGGPIPLVGGLALFAGFTLVLGLRYGLDGEIGVLLGAGLLLVLMGVWDDRHHLTPRFRFVIQIGAACLMIFAANVVLDDFGNLLWPGTLRLHWLAAPVTIFCVVGVTNATNMIDGMDGLSASVLAISLLGLGFAFWEGGLTLARDPVIPALLGGLCAYLLFNLRFPWRSSAWAFLGDAGTLFLGFVVAWLMVGHSQGSGRVIAPVTALWLFAVPLLDTVFVMVKRRKAGLSMTEADHEHLHHAFLRSGWSVNGTLGMIVLAAAGLAAVGLLLQRYGVADYVSFVLFMLICAGYYFSMTRVWRQRSMFGREIV